jgi:putative nucleotidyltransferase with HDIG domain
VFAPPTEAVLVDDDYLDDIARAFGEVIDAKSPFTAGHSSRVADLSSSLSLSLGLDQGASRAVRRAAYLHDVGKLGVSNNILDKPAGLTDPEWQEMRAHADHTREILGRIGPLAALADRAAAHHERLDGKGYPLGLSGSNVSLETRIITTCDFFDALTADRPYRSAMSVDTALGVMKQEVGTALDPLCFDALEAIAKRG